MGKTRQNKADYPVFPNGIRCDSWHRRCGRTAAGRKRIVAAHAFRFLKGVNDDNNKKKKKKKKKKSEIFGDFDFFFVFVFSSVAPEN
jgi:hypothetical protein